MPEEKSFPTKEQRRVCWESRDTYWQCLDDKAPAHQATSGDKEPAVCLQFRKLFQANCPSQWVKHFDRKRTYEQFKEKVQAGYDPLKQQ